jgi:hypothetical protein
MCYGKFWIFLIVFEVFRGSALQRVIKTTLTNRRIRTMMTREEYEYHEIYEGLSVLAQKAINRAFGKCVATLEIGMPAGWVPKHDDRAEALIAAITKYVQECVIA